MDFDIIVSCHGQFATIFTISFYFLSTVAPSIANRLYYYCNDGTQGYGNEWTRRLGGRCCGHDGEDFGRHHG